MDHLLELTVDFILIVLQLRCAYVSVNTLHSVCGSTLHSPVYISLVRIGPYHIYFRFNETEKIFEYVRSGPVR